jgi:hypothetical protein
VDADVRKWVSVICLFVFLFFFFFSSFYFFVALSACSQSSFFAIMTWMGSGGLWLRRTQAVVEIRPRQTRRVMVMDDDARTGQAGQAGQTKGQAGRDAEYLCNLG